MATLDLTVNISAEIEKHIKRVMAEAQADATVDHATALDWCVAKVAAFRGMSESEVAQMIGIQPD